MGTRIFGPILFENTLNTAVFLQFLNIEVENYLDSLPLKLRRELYF